MAPLIYMLHRHRGGWRWAVHHAWESQVNDNPLAGCINAGWAETEEAADELGQVVLYSMLKWFHLAGLKATVVNLRPETDPVAHLQVVPVDVNDLVVEMGVMG